MTRNYLARLLPFSSSTTPLQAVTYLLGVALFSISFLVFLNSAVSFVITDLIGIKDAVGDIVGTLGFVDEVVALIACPLWGLASDRLGVRWVAVLGYGVIGLALFVFVQARAVYPSLVLARILFATGATAAATMVTAILPVMTDDDGKEDGGAEGRRKPLPENQRHSMFSMESDLTITPERFERSLSRDGRDGERHAHGHDETIDGKGRKPSALAGYVGLFSGCGALVALVLFLPLPTQFSKREGVTQAEAVTYSFYVVGCVSFLVALFVFFGFKGLKGEEGKGWRTLLGLGRRSRSRSRSLDSDEPLWATGSHKTEHVQYRHLLFSALRLGITDRHIAIGYLGGFVARASSVAISLFIPLYVNTFFMRNGFCQGSPNDPSDELKKECRKAYILSSILTGVSQLVALLCAPAFGYLSARKWRGLNLPILVATSCGVIGYAVFPKLQSPEIKDINGRGGSGFVFLIMAFLGISQIGAIVCSLGSLGRGVLNAELPTEAEQLLRDEQQEPNEADDESAQLLASDDVPEEQVVSRKQLKGSIAGIYSGCGGVGILLLTKLGGYLFDVASWGAPFYMMATFNAILFVATLGIDLGVVIRGRTRK